MPEKRMPFELQRGMLRKIGEKLAIGQGTDASEAVEALDSLDSALSYSENQRLYFGELERRGIRTVPKEEAGAKELERYVGETIQQTPELREYFEQITGELTVARTELGRIKERHAKLKKETERWKELSEVERARLMAETEELKRGLETLLGGLPRSWVEELLVVFMKLPKASEESFWTWLKENTNLVKEAHEKKVLATSLEPQMKEYLEKRPAPPPKPLIPPRPEPRYKVGDEAFELETGRKVVVRQQFWNELTRKWDYLIEDRGKVKRVTEDKLVPLPPLPAAAVRAPRAPVAPRAPLPAKTLEELTICPYTKHLLTPFKGPVAVVVEQPVTMEEEVKREMAGRPEWEIRSAITRREWDLKEKGIEDRGAVVGYKRVPESVPIPLGLLVYLDDKKDCPGFGKFYLVEDMRLKGLAYDELVERVRRFMARITRPIVPAPRVRGGPTPLEEHYAVIRNIEGDPAFRKYVEEEVGMKWDVYLRSGGWDKDALRRSFAEKAR